MKRLLAVIIMICLFIPIVCAEGTSLTESILALDTETLEDLRNLIDAEITRRKKDEAKRSDDFGMWEIAYYVDSFKTPTDEAYIRNKKYIQGTFSNSATTSSSLNVLFLIDKDSVAIIMDEYGSYRVNNPYSSEIKSYKMLVRADSNNTYTFYLHIKPGGDRLFFSNKDREGEMIDLLKNSLRLEFYIEDQQYKTSTYNFTIENTLNFTDIYEYLCPSMPSSIDENNPTEDADTKDIILPEGLWHIGTDIPAGVYQISKRDSEYIVGVSVWDHFCEDYYDYPTIYDYILIDEQKVTGKMELLDGWIIEVTSPVILMKDTE